jgi:hypothetical protein
MRLIGDYNARVAGDPDSGYEYDPRNERDAINSGKRDFWDSGVRTLRLLKMLSC